MALTWMSQTGLFCDWEFLLGEVYRAPGSRDQMDTVMALVTGKDGCEVVLQ